jgi:methylenetetrahydrofolate dehydrogenase (NADP+)/methenyltetrahydrofolate cyclohydrolase
VDGFHPESAGHLLQGEPTFVAATPAGIMEILRAYEIPLEGARAVVVGRSNIVGKPMALLLLAENATVTVCHSRTRDLARVVGEADVVVAAVGRAAMATRGWSSGRGRDRRRHQPRRREGRRGRAEDGARSRGT